MSQKRVPDRITDTLLGCRITVSIRKLQELRKDIIGCYESDICLYICMIMSMSIFVAYIPNQDNRRKNLGVEDVKYIYMV